MVFLHPNQGIVSTKFIGLATVEHDACCQVSSSADLQVAMARNINNQIVICEDASMGQVLVTGARRGIGKAIALAMAKANYDVAVADIDDGDELQAVSKQIADMGLKTVAIKADISDLASHARIIAQAEAALGPLTTLVNNAGVSVISRGDLLDVSPESFDRCMNVNARGTFFLTQAFARRMRETMTECHRSIITITSSNVSAVSIARGEYCMSKTAASMMSKLFAARLSDEDIGVYEIQPGFIETDMTAPVKSKYDALIAGGLTTIKRFGSPEEIGRIAVTLADGSLPYTSGQAIQADGGLLTVRY
jgi:NAD(P)-dependent dehydrogenase (short-subunit alcohol dehydrogenase family)